MTTIDIDFAEVQSAVKDLVDVVGYGTGDEPVVASAAFKNDAHDHKGRFAPKGQGVRAGAILAQQTLPEVELFDGLPVHDAGTGTDPQTEAVAANRRQLIDALGADGESIVAGVEAWTGAGASDKSLREAIRKGDPRYAGFVAALDTAPPVPDALYRGMHWMSQDQVDAVTGLTPGDVLPVDGIASFTTNAGHAQAFVGTPNGGMLAGDGVFITIKPGSARALDIDSISNTPAEREHLIGRDLRVVSHRVQRKFDPDEEQEMVWVEIEAETV